MEWLEQPPIPLSVLLRKDGRKQPARGKEGEMRYPVSGTSTQTLPNDTCTGATGVTTLLSITSGRVFWCRGFFSTGAATFGPVTVYDATTQSTATSHPIRFRVYLGEATGAGTGGGFTMREFPAPGVKFSNNYVLARLHASGATDTLVGSCGVWGYEE